MTEQLKQSKNRDGLRPLLSNWGGRATALVGAGAVAAALVACGNGGATTTRASGTTGTTSTSRSSDEPAASHWILEAGDLPTGWRERNFKSPGDHFNFRGTFCGVNFEPLPPVQAGTRRFVESGLGPWLAQDVRVYGDDQAEAVISAFRAALPTCTETEVPPSMDTPEKFTLKVEPITVAGLGPDSVAWRFTRVGAGDKPFVSDTVFTRRGRTLVALCSYGFGPEPDRNVLVKAVAALQAKPQS